MNNIICEVIPSIYNKDKFNIHSYLMIKNKNRRNLYYWSYKKHNLLQCYRWVTIRLIED